MTTTTVTVNNRTFMRLLGTSTEHREAAGVAIIMMAVTVFYESGATFMPGYAFHLGAFLGTWMGLVCVWLTRTENILCWPWGIASSMFLGWFFRDIGLPGQQWLNWGFFLIVQLWAWPYWVFGSKRTDDLPVTLLSSFGRAVALGCLVGGAWATYAFIDMFAYQPQYPILDAVVVSASIVAQFLLGRKKVESWLLWLGPVNVVSIFLFMLTGAYVLTALYVAFLVHACIALRSWYLAREVS
jgi:nicotinamide mononucleotide transporter